MKNIFMRPVDFMPKYKVSYTQFMNEKLVDILKCICFL